MSPIILVIFIPGLVVLFILGFSLSRRSRPKRKY